MSISVKTLAATVVSTDDDSGGWTAVASSPSIDRDGERLASGCFEPLPASVPVHDGHPLDRGAVPSARQVGRARPYYRDGVLWVEGKFSASPQGQQLRAMVNEGTIDAMSVMFHNPERKMIQGVRTIVSAELLAVDFVSIPSNRDALVLSARSAAPALTARSAVDVIIAAAEASVHELDAVDAIAADPLNKMYRLLGEAEHLLAAIDGDAARRNASRAFADAQALLDDLNRRN